MEYRALSLTLVAASLDFLGVTLSMADLTTWTADATAGVLRADRERGQAV